MLIEYLMLLGNCNEYFRCDELYCFYFLDVYIEIFVGEMI